MRKKGPLDWSPRDTIPGVPIWPEFLDAYLEAALFTGLDDAGHPLDDKYTVQDFAQEAIDKSIEETNDFIMMNKKDLESVGSMEVHGHDFSLTRNRHGAGFWDRGYGAVGDRLTKAAHGYGEANAYVGYDGLLYIS